MTARRQLAIDERRFQQAWKNISVLTSYARLDWIVVTVQTNAALNPNPNMKRILLFFVLSFAFTWPSAGQGNSPSLTFDDLGLGGGTATSGTYNSNDTFSFDVLLTFENYSAIGLSFWLGTNSVFGGSLSITGITYGTAFPNHGNPTFPIPFPGGFENFDLGGSTSPNTPLPPGTYFVEHITFSIAGAVPGTYDLASTTANPFTSEVTSFDGTNFVDHNLPASHYSVTIVPEPRTLALIGLGTILGLSFMARRRSGFATLRRRGA